MAVLAAGIGGPLDTLSQMSLPAWRKLIHGNSPHPACRGGSRNFALLDFDGKASSAESREPLGQAQWGEFQQVGGPSRRASHHGWRGVSIITVSSVSGQRAGGLVAYSTSKAAIQMLTRPAALKGATMT